MWADGWGVGRVSRQNGEHSSYPPLLTKGGLVPSGSLPPPPPPRPLPPPPFNSNLLPFATEPRLCFLACGGVLCVLFIKAVCCVPSTVSLLCTLRLVCHCSFVEELSRWFHNHHPLTPHWPRSGHKAPPLGTTFHSPSCPKVHSFCTCTVIVHTVPV